MIYQFNAPPVLRPLVKKAAKKYRDTGCAKDLIKLIPIDDLGGERISVEVPDHWRYVNCRGVIDTITRKIDRNIVNQMKPINADPISGEFEVEMISLRLMVPESAVEFFRTRTKVVKQIYFDELSEYHCKYEYETESAENNPEHQNPVCNNMGFLATQSFTGKPVAVRIRVPFQLHIDIRLFVLDLWGTM